MSHKSVLQKESEEEGVVVLHPETQTDTPQWTFIPSSSSLLVSDSGGSALPPPHPPILARCDPDDGSF